MLWNMADVLYYCTALVLQERREGGGGVYIMTGRIKPGRR